MIIAVEFTHVSRHYGNVKAVDDVSICIAEGEFFSMLGPSGSGKTTCLRLIAGFEQPTSGSIQIFGQEAAGAPPYEREVNTVFQDYALFPHMNVLDNVAYGLSVKGIAKHACITRAEEALNMVALAEYSKRKPSELSGGQRQRVALARALVNKPRVLLLDEPLGALDLKLREQMQHELKTLHKQLGITFIYVTHDQTEALSMSDRVAVFNKGRIEQVDSPRNLYRQPKTSFVADFVGTSNVINSELALQITANHQPFSIRPEHIFFDNGAKHPNTFAVNGTVVDLQYQGANNKITFDAGTQKISFVVSSADYNEAELPKIGNYLIVRWLKSNMVMLENKSKSI
ncbi:MAG: ABC transporter ATP-binding protein [Bdellovibrio sp.]|nr:ABC transporter ATP-binding protein [Methylotenera sp.]